MSTVHSYTFFGENICIVCCINRLNAPFTPAIGSTLWCKCPVNKLISIETSYRADHYHWFYWTRRLLSSLVFTCKCRCRVLFYCHYGHWVCKLPIEIAEVDTQVEFNERRAVKERKRDRQRGEINSMDRRLEWTRMSAVNYCAAPALAISLQADLCVSSCPQS